jgi:putative OPT family oligopeptide transporter
MASSSDRSPSPPPAVTALRATAVPELTARALVVGALIGVALAAGNVYSGLKIAYLDSGNITAAILGFALLESLRFFVQHSSVLEANVIATCASSAGAMAGVVGVCGPIAALSLMGHDYPAWALLLWGLALGCLGILIALPLRRQLVEVEALPFPTGATTATVLIEMDGARSAGVRRARALLLAAAAAMLVTWFRDGRPAWIPAASTLPLSLGGVSAETLAIAFSFSPLVISTGALVGLRAGLSLLLGAAVAWGVLAPAMLHAGVVDPAYVSMSAWLMWPGVALMVASALTGIVLEWRTLVRAAADLARLRREQSGAAVGRTTLVLLFALGLAALIGVIALGWRVFDAHPLFSLFGFGLSLLLSTVCARAAGETDQAPVGAMGGLTQILMGLLAPGRPVLSLTSGGLVSGVASQTYQMMQSFKAGHLLRSSPRRLFIAQLLGMGVGLVVVVPVYWILTRAYRLGSAAMPAAAPLSWKATAEVVQNGAAAMPHSAVVAALVAAAAGIVITALGRGRLGRLLPSPIAIGMAFLLPASFSLTMCAGALLVLLGRRLAPAWTERYASSLAAGGIAGEALAGVLIAILTVEGILVPR